MTRARRQQAHTRAKQRHEARRRDKRKAARAGKRTLPAAMRTANRLPYAPVSKMSQGALLAWLLGTH